MDFTTFEDFNYLFEDDPSQNGIQNYFYAVVDEFWNTLDHEAYHYVVVVSVSLTSQSNQFEAAIADLIDYGWFTQSAANTNSPGNAFGDTLPNVITVGAYNTDSSDTGWVQIVTITLKLIYMQTAMSRTRNGMMDGILAPLSRPQLWPPK